MARPEHQYLVVLAPRYPLRNSYFSRVAVVSATSKEKAIQKSGLLAWRNKVVKDAYLTPKAHKLEMDRNYLI